MQAFDLSRYSALTPLRVSALTQSFSASLDGRPVIIKQLKPGLAADAATRRAWLEQAQLAGQVRHSGLVEVLDFGEHEGAAYLAGAWIDGCALREAFEARPPESRAVGAGDAVAIGRAVLEVLRALAAAQRPLLHLNLTPDNLRITPEGRIRVTEPGLWAAIDPQEAARLHFDGGKVGYQSPEQVQARGKLDARSDLFSLGCILYELLTGAPPFSGKTQLLVAMAISRGDRQPLATVRPDLPENVVAIVEALCAHDPEARFGSAAAALTALSTCQDPPTDLLLFADVARARGTLGSPAAPKGAADGRTVRLPSSEADRDGSTVPFVWAQQGPGGSPSPPSPATASEPSSPGPSARVAPPSVAKPPPVRPAGSAPSAGPPRGASPAHPPAPGAGPAGSRNAAPSPVPPPMVGHGGASAAGAPAPPRAPAPAASGRSAPPVAPPPMVNPPPMLHGGQPPSSPSAPVPAGPAPPPRDLAPPQAPPLATGSPPPPASPVVTGSPSSPAASASGARSGPGGAPLPSSPAPPPAWSDAGSSPGAASSGGGRGLGGAPVAGAPLSPGTGGATPQPLPAPPGPGASDSGPVAGGPSLHVSASAGASPKRWQEPSKTVFQMKAYRGPGAGDDARRQGMPLAMKLILAGMATFGVVLLVALAVRVLR